MIETPDLVKVSSGRKIARNSVWLLVGRLASQIAGLLFSVLVARRLGEVGLGQYAFIASVIFLGNLTTTFGTDMLVMREVASSRDLSVVPASLWLQLALTLPFVLLVFLFAPFIPNQNAEAILSLRILSLALFPMALYSVFSALLRGLERMDAFTWLNLLNGSLLVALTWFFVQDSSSIVNVAWLLLLINLLSASVAGLLCLPQLPAPAMWRPNSKQLIALISATAPIAILGFLGAAYQRSGIFLISVTQGAASTGLLSAAVRVVDAAKLGHFAVLGALFPAMSQTHFNPHPRFRKLFATSLNFLLLLSIGVAIALMIFSDLLIPMLFGTHFIEAIPSLKILVWILVPATLTYFFSLRLLAIKKEKTIMTSLIASMAALFSIALITIPRWELLGMAWAMVVAESTQALFLIYYWRKMKTD